MMGSGGGRRHEGSAPLARRAVITHIAVRRQPDAAHSTWGGKIQETSYPVLGKFRNFLTGPSKKAAVAETLHRRRRLVVAPPLPIVYAIGDVHGCLDELVEAEERIAADRVSPDAMKLVVPLGDYVDRGPDSAGVLEYLSQPSPFEIERVCLCGNHDDAMAAFVRDPLANLGWLSVGGDATLKSYGIDPLHALQPRRRADLRGVLAGAVPAHHLAFIDSLPVCLRVGDVVFVHAGLDPTRTLEAQTDEDMMSGPRAVPVEWSRHPGHGRSRPHAIGRHLDRTRPHRHRYRSLRDRKAVRSEVEDGTFTLL